MRKIVKPFILLVLFILVYVPSYAVPVANFGKYSSGSSIDIWLLSVLCDSDLSLTLTFGEDVSFILGNTQGNVLWKGNSPDSSSRTMSFNGRVASGNYFFEVTDGSGSGSGGSGSPDDDDFTGLTQSGDNFSGEGQGTETKIDIAVSPVPEPGAIFLFGIGMLMVGATLRSKAS